MKELSFITGTQFWYLLPIPDPLVATSSACITVSDSYKYLRLKVHRILMRNIDLEQVYSLWLSQLVLLV